ncbi:unannotated protein [freshwater metagenome]|uniref:Unannotated protein n=1 Tax=freshwater metagenome TaxID=449393 RepID=A0A6J6KQ58_9ZZZZ
MRGFVHHDGEASKDGGHQEKSERPEKPDSAPRWNQECKKRAGPQRENAKRIANTRNLRQFVAHLGRENAV